MGPEQDRTGLPDRAARTGPLVQDSQGKTERRGYTEQGSQYRAASTGQPEHERQNMTGR